MAGRGVRFGLERGRREAGMRERVAVRYLDGHVVKGYTTELLPTRSSFRLIERETGTEREIEFADLKAVFFVRSFDTDGQLRPRDDIERVGLGPKLRVRFSDGEELVGFGSNYGPDRRTFVLFPGDPDSNSHKIVVVLAATESVEYV